MSEEFPYADIIIMALVAGFILLRLRSILGQKDENDKNNFFQPQQKEESITETLEKIVQITNKSEKPKAKIDNDPYVMTLAEGDVLTAINEIKTKDASFNATTFMDGAKMAFEMVFDAFVKADKNTLNMLLSKEINDDFLRNIEERDKQETKQETTLLSVTAKEITQAKLDRNMAKITVAFESEQVTVERSKTGEIVSGDASDVQTVLDEWTFERDVTSKNPNWKIIET